MSFTIRRYTLSRKRLLSLSTLQMVSLYMLGCITLISCAEKPTLENCFVTTIKVATVTENPAQDVVLTASYGEDFYIKDGVEKGVDAQSLEFKIQDKKVEIYVLKLIFGHSKNVAQIVLNDTIVYTEFRPSNE